MSFAWVSWSLERARAFELGLAVLCLGTTMVFAGGGSAAPTATKFQGQKDGSAGPRTFDGMVTDSECGARHPRDSNMSPAECTRFCVKKGIKYALVDGEHTYELRGSTAQLDRFAGQRAQIAGTLSGASIVVVAIKPE